MGLPWRPTRARQCLAMQRLASGCGQPARLLSGILESPPTGAPIITASSKLCRRACSRGAAAAAATVGLRSGGSNPFPRNGFP